MERKSDLIPINVCKRATRIVESIENYQSRIGSGLSCLEAHVVHEERQYCCLHCYTFSLVQLRQIDSVDPGNPATPITPPPFYTYTFSLLPSFSDSNFFKFKNLQARIYETCFYFDPWKMKKILLSNLLKNPLSKNEDEKSWRIFSFAKRMHFLNGNQKPWTVKSCFIYTGC